MAHDSGVLIHDIQRLAGRADVIEVLDVLRRARDSGASRVDLGIKNISSVYPSGAVPLAAIVNQFRDDGLNVRFVGIPPDSYFEHARVRAPILASEQSLNEPGSRLNIVWAYTEDSVVHLANCIIEELSRRIEFGDGALNAITWGLFEVLDNVFQHSETDTGYFMAQIHKTSHRLNFCIADSGIGVHRSFYKGGKYRPPTAFDALTLAVREGVSGTGDKRGNGLYGLKGLIEASDGQLNMWSGRGILRVAPSGIEGRNAVSNLIIGPDNYCTIIEFTLDVSKPIDLGKILGVRQIDLRLEAIEDDSGVHVIKLSEHAQGTGTRAAAENLRNYLMNYLNAGAPYLILDFTGVSMVSSSFADETIGKLAERFGMLGFAERFRLVNMSEQVRMLLDRAISLRISASYYRDDRITYESLGGMADYAILIRLNRPRMRSKAVNRVDYSNRIVRGSQPFILLDRVSIDAYVSPEVDLVTAAVNLRNTILVSGENKLHISAGRPFDFNLSGRISSNFDVITKRIIVSADPANIVQCPYMGDPFKLQGIQFGTVTDSLFPLFRLLPVEATA
jgi:anti-anti-sigma regulatory factor